MNKFRSDQDFGRDHEGHEFNLDTVDFVSEWAVDCDDIGNPGFCEASIADSLRPAWC